MAPRSPDFKRSNSLMNLIADTSTKRPQLVPETGWYRIAVTELYEGSGSGGQFYGSTLNVFKNTWANAGGSGNPNASWYLSDDGEVRFRGKITGGSEGTVAFVLPEEIRPEYAETFIVAVDGGGNATVVIRQNGEVYIEAINVV